MSKFQQYPGATFSEIDVENYLEELAKKHLSLWLILE